MEGILYNSPEHKEHEIQWNYLSEHVDHVSDMYGWTGKLSASFCYDQPRWSCTFENVVDQNTSDEYVLKFECETVDEFIRLLYDDGEVPVL